MLAEPGWGFAPSCHHSAEEMSWGSGQEQRRDLGSSPHCCWFIFSLQSVWPQALGISARLVCVEIPPVAHPAESRVSWPGGHRPVIPQRQRLGGIVTVGDLTGLGVTGQAGMASN